MTSTFGDELARWRQCRHCSFRRLAERVAYDASALSKVEKGQRKASLRLAKLCDAALDANGQLVAAWMAAQRIVRPAQLPAAPARFVGRDPHLAELTRALTNRLPSAPVVMTIDGPAGVGKTALALRWAHTAASRFIDGQLYADLGGFTAGTVPPMDPRTVLGWFCATLDAHATIPDTLHERAALYRSLLANRHVLILLDNAASTQQVEQLLPGTPGCTALVTSRRALSGLTIGADAHRVTLGPLTEPDSTALIGQLIGADRANAQPTAVLDLTRLCDHLPLAIRIAADHLTHHPSQPVADLAAQIGSNNHGLDALTTGDGHTLHDVLTWSYTRLPDDTARLFRLLSLHQGPSLSAGAASALAGTDPQLATRQLRELANVHLIELDHHHRTTLPGLIHAYATRQCQQHDNLAERREAQCRLATWYRNTVTWGSCSACVTGRLRSPLVIRYCFDHGFRSAGGRR